MFGSATSQVGAAHTSACPPGCATDHRQAAKAVAGASGHREVDAVINRHQGLGVFGRETPISGNVPGKLAPLCTESAGRPQSMS